MSGYVELQCASHFSFLRGVSSAEELFATAAMRGMEALAITDLNSLSGIVRAHEAARTTGVRLIVGCRLRLRDSSELLVYPKNRPAYARLCRLLSVGKGRAGKAKCDLTWEDVENWSEGLIAILVPDRPNAALRTRLKRLKTIWPEDGYCALTLLRRPGDALRLHQVAQMAAEFGVMPVVTNDVLFHEPSRRVLQNVVTCMPLCFLCHSCVLSVRLPAHFCTRALLNEAVNNERERCGAKACDHFREQC